ncbi:MAG: GDP-mannose 4,6-dehydratase [Candidatus Eremiobacteraeota bacterium]|nr:GDP-mannose 4,6-dehydratase [Candidatus Eremiobacteraeota bacterium]MBV9262784.1 GDP-mannose 4,6-dehydratase [Candidatus Eremiobacteraeota bacterium]
MMRALVTGASGFVGGYLVAALRRNGAEVVPCGGPREGGDYFPIDLHDVASLERALEAARPQVVFHLAAQTFVPQALESPLETYDVNALGTARLAEAVRRYAGAPPRVIFASTAEVYGPRSPSDYPLREDLDVRPANPYGASKAAAEAMLGAAARSFGGDVLIARSFNHIGPGQNERFVVASFAAQLSRVARGAPPQLFVGDLTPARDFLDVRDVVEAYIALARKPSPPHRAGCEVYNVCSGRAVAIRDILRELIAIARVPVEVREEPQRMRASETPLSVGDPAKLRERTGWTPKIPLVQTLRDVYEGALRERD